jgi:hypothetical protein
MKGIINLEATIMLLMYFSLIGLLVESLSNTNDSLKEKIDLISAKSNAMKCASIADSIYANAGGKIQVKEKCFFEKGKMKSKKGKQKAEEKTLTKEIKNSQEGIAIGVEEHYK